MRWKWKALSCLLSSGGVAALLTGQYALNAAAPPLLTPRHTAVAPVLTARDFGPAPRMTIRLTPVDMENAPRMTIWVGPLELDQAPAMTIQLVQGQEPVPLPSQPLASAASPLTSSGTAELLFGGLATLGTVGGQPSTRPAAETAAIPQVSTNIVAGGEAVTRATTDLGDLLGKSVSALGVETQRRNPVTSDPHIRGYWGG